MNTPRSQRRKSKVCYKEDDSFVEEFKYYTPSKSKSTKSVSNNVPFPRLNKVNKSSRDEIEMAVSAEDSGSEPDKNILSNARTLKNMSVDNASSPASAVRRGTRLRNKTTVAIEAEISHKRLKKLTLTGSDYSESDDTDNDMEPIENPSSLFTEDDIEGHKLFGFKNVHKKQDMVKKAILSALESPKIQLLGEPKINKACASPKTPKLLKGNNTPLRGKKSLGTPLTPKSIKPLTDCEKTPHQLRKKMKKRLETMALQDSEGSDFYDSGSDFCPSDDPSSGDGEESDSNDDKEESSESDGTISKTKSKMPAKQREKYPIKQYTLRQKKIDKDTNFILKADDYFIMHANKKITTSNHTLQRLKNPHFTEDKLEEILKNQKISKPHQIAINELLEDHQMAFDKWLYILSEGFSILLHGLGSKKTLIQEFQNNKIKEYPCIVLNGFFPSLTLRDILESIITDLFKMSSVPSNVYEAVDIIRNEMSALPNEKLFLLIHNIDGIMLRNNKTQDVISKLSKINNIHLVASLDHINAPLIWDHTKLSNYNFSWWDVTTLLPYSHETSFESSLLVHKSGALALSSLKNVFQSLTINARGIFQIIVNNQLKNKKTPHYQGISFKDLYWTAREGFLVSSDLALRAQLTEFLDHKLVKAKRTADGTENLIIPIDNKLLQQFIDQHE